VAATIRARHADQLSLDTIGPPLIDTTFVVLDLETTGLSPARDRITEVGAVKVRGGEVLGELATFVDPQRPIPAAISALTGITDHLVRDAPPIEDVLDVLLDFLDGAVFVAHNASFDVGFVRAAVTRCGFGDFTPTVVDTARLARRLLRDEVRDVRLATLARHLRARTTPSHRALTDARATVDVLHGLLERAGSMGATTLPDLQALTRVASDHRFRRRALVDDAPRGCGVYRFLGADGEVLYVGKATDLRARLRTYFTSDPRRQVEQLVRDTVRVTWLCTPTLLEAEIRELREIRTHLPRYNRRSTRPSTPVHVALTAEPFPRLSIVARPREAHRRTVGPITSRRLAQRFVEAIESVSAVRSCTLRLRRAQDHRACVLKQLDRCAAPCDGSQSTTAYEAAIELLEHQLDDPTPLLDTLEQRMRTLADAGSYERAAEARAHVHALARVLRRARVHAAITAPAEIVVAWPTPDATEVVVLHHGRLAGSLRLDGPATDEVILGHLALTPLDESADMHADETEIALVIGALGRAGGRVVRVEGTWAEPLPGGVLLASLDARAREVDRVARRDRQTTSNHGPIASAGRARTPGSRPSHSTQAR
jgi:DNA polymerase III subunit epsilon